MTKKEKVIYLLKKYGYVLILSVCAVVIISAVVASTKRNNQNNVDEVVNVNASVVNETACLPVLNATVAKGYSNTALQYNDTLKQYEAHLGVDFVASSGSKVYSILDGTVEDVGNNYLKGNYVVVSHKNGLKSVYSSLGEEILVSKGEYVKKGDTIAVVGNSAYGELEEGSHLHFELLDDDKKIDPAGYLDIGNK